MTAALFPLNNSRIPFKSWVSLCKPKIKETSTVPETMTKASIYSNTRSQPALKSGVDDRYEFMVFALKRYEDRGPAKFFLINFYRQPER